jgi:DNA invertase Pin-like site-specific DNA recombinase
LADITTGKGATMKELVAYCRVSTKQQGASGLGLEAQRTAVESYARQNGARIATIYVEVESGKKADRPELAKALAHARRSKATLCVAKLDRLTRNVAFLAALLESKVEFVACDNPHANKLTIHLLAAVAEHEAEMISQRTKAALGAAKARGVALGSAREGHWDGLEKRRQAGAERGAAASAEVRSKAAAEAYADLQPMMDKLRSEGASLQAIADKLNSEGHTTRRGKPWNPVQVGRVMARAGE